MQIRLRPRSGVYSGLDMFFRSNPLNLTKCKIDFPSENPGKYQNVISIRIHVKILKTPVFKKSLRGFQKRPNSLSYSANYIDIALYNFKLYKS